MPEQDLLEKENMGAVKIAQRGQALMALNTLVGHKKYLITEKQIKDIITLLQRVEYLYAAPAINELNKLPEIIDQEFAPDEEIDCSPGAISAFPKNSSTMSTTG